MAFSTSRVTLATLTTMQSDQMKLKALLIAYIVDLIYLCRHMMHEIVVNVFFQCFNVSDLETNVIILRHCF
jgi:hypothetical protein